MPFLIILNLFLGRLFFNFKAWLIVEGALILIFLVYYYILSRKIISGINNAGRKGNVIDVEGEVVSERRS